MSMGHDEMYSPSGIHEQVPSEDTIMFVGNLLSMSSSALSFTSFTPLTAVRSHQTVFVDCWTCLPTLQLSLVLILPTFESEGWPVNLGG